MRFAACSTQHEVPGTVGCPRPAAAGVREAAIQGTSARGSRLSVRASADRTLVSRSPAAAPHNCIGGSEVNCLPGPSEAALMFADPSKMQNADGVPLPSHWYKGPVSIM